MRYRLGIAILTILAGVGATAPAEAADLFSKAFKFKANTRLDVGIDLPEGLRLDSVESGSPIRAEEHPRALRGSRKRRSRCRTSAVRPSASGSSSRSWTTRAGCYNNEFDEYNL